MQKNSIDKKYSFMCHCGNSPVEISFVADHFLQARSPYLDLLPPIWWDINESGKVRCETDGHRWPEELAKSYFTREAKRYARKILKGEELLYCEVCGQDIVLNKK